MESVAPAGGVMLSESTARLVEHAAVLAEPEMAHIKGCEQPVPACQLLGMAVQAGRIGRSDTTLVGRQWEMSTVTGMLERSASGRGCVVGVVGQAGIGKSRLVAERLRWRATVVSRCSRRSASPTPGKSRLMWWRACCGK